MMIGRKNIFFIFFILHFFNTTTQAVGPDAIRGTWDCLKPEYKRCSPLQGAIWWESGLVKKYYDFGRSKTKIGEKTFEADDTVELTKTLFHPVQGSFNVSTIKNRPAAHMSPRTIAKVIAEIEKAYGPDGTEELTTETIKTVVEEDEDFKSSLDITREELKKASSDLKETKDEFAPIQQQIKDADKKINLLRKNSTNFAPAILSWYAF